MTIPLQVHFRDMVPLAGLEAAIRRRADALVRWTRECAMRLGARMN